MNASEPEIAIEARQLRRAFLDTDSNRDIGGALVLDTLDFRIASGEFVALLGPSGCGKSTLLRLVAGLDSPTDGHLSVQSKASVMKSGPFDRGFVFQDAHLLPWRTVLENVALPLELARVAKDERHEAAAKALGKVGLHDAVGKFPNQLSGGMKMRVSLARALVARPSLLLLDEPFAALDEQTRFRLQDDLRTLWGESGLTILFVTHSIAEAAYLANRAFVFSSRPARIVLDRKLELNSVRRRTDTDLQAEIQILSRAMGEPH